MTASLSEAFGDNYESYPPSDMQKKKKKSVKVKKYGTEVVSPSRFTAPEPRKELNVTLGGYPEEDNQYLKISNKNEYGPTDYNIKPKDVQEYIYQMNQNYVDNNTNANIIQRTLSNPNGVNIDDNSEYEDNEEVPTSTPTTTPNVRENMEVDPRIADFNSKLDLILEKLGHFDEPAQENIHDIILFVIFGIFIIFILDSVYRVGKMTL
jgi:hypothetical protein